MTYLNFEKKNCNGLENDFYFFLLNFDCLKINYCKTNAMHFKHRYEIFTLRIVFSLIIHSFIICFFHLFIILAEGRYNFWKLLCSIIYMKKVKKKKCFWRTSNSKDPHLLGKAVHIFCLRLRLVQHFKLNLCNFNCCAFFVQLNLTVSPLSEAFILTTLTHYGESLVCGWKKS